MNKFWKKAIAWAAVIVAAFGFAGCRGTGGGGEGEEIDATKTQLAVGNFDGGYGSAWLENAKTRFEEKYKDVSFEEGKTGVQVVIDTHTRYSGLGMSNYISNWPQHVIFSEGIDYYNLVNTGSIVDMTDATTTPLNVDFITGKTDPSAEDETIENKMNKSMAAFYKKNGQNYYGVPFYEAAYGIIYDMDVFEEYGLYYCEEGYGDAAGFAQSTDGVWIGRDGEELGAAKRMTLEQAKAAGLKLSKGPDGKEGTYDDGMPATYDDFFALCERIAFYNMEPIVWPGAHQSYMNYLAYNLWTDYEGEEQMLNNFNFNVTATDLIDVNSYDPVKNTFKTYQKDINASNGYLLNAQAGKFYAISFMERISRDVRYYDERYCFNGVVNQSDSQGYFVNSALPNNTKIAMLVDGSWWQNEASDIFEAMASQYDEKYSKANRRFGTMPTPKATRDKVGEPFTRAQSTSTLCCINAHTVKDEKMLNLAKQFIRFCHTDEMLVEFNKITGSCKPYDYDLTDAEYESLSEYGKQNYDLHKNAKLVFTYSQHPINMADPNRFSSCGDTFVSGINTYMTTAFHNDKDLTAWSYFKTIVDEHNEKKWKDTYGSVINR